MADICYMTGVSSANQQVQVQSQIATAVARKSLDVARQQGQAVISLLSDARQTQPQIQAPHASQEPGKSVQLDLRG